MFKKIATSIIGCGILALIKGLSSYTLFGIYLNTNIVIVGCALSIILPNTFDLGVSDWEKANILDKILPILVLVIFMLLCKSLYQSYSILTLNSLFLGFIFSYIGKVIDR